MTLKIQGNSVTSSVHRDIWHYNALGPRAETIYKCIMDCREVHIDQLVDHTNIDSRIIENAITKLFKNGLVEPLGSGFYRGINMTNEKMVEIAKKYGTLGSCDKRVERHQEERKQYISQNMMRQKYYWMKKYGKYLHRNTKGHQISSYGHSNDNLENE